MVLATTSMLRQAQHDSNVCHPDPAIGGTKDDNKKIS